MANIPITTVVAILLTLTQACTIPTPSLAEEQGLTQKATTQPKGGNDAPKPRKADGPTSKPTTAPAGDGAAGKEEAPEAGEPVTVDTSPAIPYPLGEWVTYHWLRDGQRIGVSNLRFDAIDGEPERVRLSRTFEYRVPGRYIYMEDEAELNQSLHPIEVSEIHKASANRLAGATTVKTEIEPGIALVTFQSDAGLVKEPRLHEVDLDEEVYLYPKYSFLAETCMVFQEKGPGKYALLCPYEARVYDVEVKRLRTETHDGKKLTRWNIKHATFSADFWLTENGELEKYRQESTGGVTEVERAR